MREEYLCPEDCDYLDARIGLVKCRLHNEILGTYKDRRIKAEICVVK